MVDAVEFGSMYLVGTDATLSYLLLIFYYIQHRNGQCKWEVLYVTAVGGTIDVLQILFGQSSPGRIELNNGNQSPWIRFCGWLMTCPVLLVLLSNLAGESRYNYTRSLFLLLANQAMILAGATSSFATYDSWKVVFYMIGLFCFLVIFRISRQIFSEGHAIFPSKAALILNWMELIFGASWFGYSLLFILAPEGYGVISFFASQITISVLDIISKLVYPFLGWILRWKILHTGSEDISSHIRGKSNGRPTVLIASQDSMHTLFFREKLQKYKYAVDTVTNAKELLVDLSRADYNWEFLLMDWKLAQNDQFAIMFELRKNPLLGGFIPVVAYGPKLENSKKANISTLLKQVFIDDYLESPFRDESFGRVIWRWSRNPGSSTPIQQLEDLADSVVKSQSSKNPIPQDREEFTQEILDEQLNPIYYNQRPNFQNEQINLSTNFETDIQPPYSGLSPASPSMSTTVPSFPGDSELSLRSLNTNRQAHTGGPSSPHSRLGLSPRQFLNAMNAPETSRVLSPRLSSRGSRPGADIQDDLYDFQDPWR